MTGLVNSSFNFSWNFSGDVRRISWGVWDTTNKYFVTILLEVTKSATVQVSSSSTYYGRVVGSHKGNSSYTQAIFTLYSITKKDETIYGCVLYPRNLDLMATYDTVNLAVRGGYSKKSSAFFSSAKKINKTFLEDGKHSFWQVYEIAWTFSYQWTMAILNTRPVGIEEAL